LEIAHERWYPAIRNRHSRRQYDSGRAIPPEIWQRLQTTARNFRPFPGARLELGSAAVETMFKGALGAYGKINGAPADAVLIGATRQPAFQETAGFLGEGLLLEAVSMGLSTCWVGGLFNPYAAAKQFPLQSGERVLAICALGYPVDSKTLEEKIFSRLARSHKRLPLEQLVSGIDQSKYPAWLPAALEAVRLAPSAMNRQPWRLYVESNSVLFSTAGGLYDTGISKRLDCGIAMLHFDVAARFHGIFGQWEFLETPQVARIAFYKKLLI